MARRAVSIEVTAAFVRALLRRRVVLAAVVVASAATSVARADVDLSGPWLVQEHHRYSLHGSTASHVEDWIQSGTVLSRGCDASGHCAETGTVDPVTGQFYFQLLQPIVLNVNGVPTEFPCFPLCPCNSFSGVATLDSRRFTATQTNLFYDLSAEACLDGEPIDIAGSRCGNGILESGEVCDDGNGDDHDACKSDCTPNVCGDGVLNPAAESCDDGNVVDGDGCSSTCHFVATEHDCLHAWNVPGAYSPKRVSCTDDDPTCDVGRFPFDHACTFLVGMCFKIDTPAGACAAGDVRAVNIIRPSAFSSDATAAQEHSAMEAALASIGGHAQGYCANSSRRGDPCSTNADCGSSAVGRCQRTVAFEPSLSASNRCTDFVQIRVPLRPGGRKNTQIVQLQARATRAAGGSSTDRDTLRLVCEPR